MRGRPGRRRPLASIARARLAVAVGSTRPGATRLMVFPPARSAAVSPPDALASLRALTSPWVSDMLGAVPVRHDSERVWRGVRHGFLGAEPPGVWAPAPARGGPRLPRSRWRWTRAVDWPLRVRAATSLECPCRTENALSAISRRRGHPVKAAGAEAPPRLVVGRATRTPPASPAFRRREEQRLRRTDEKLCQDRRHARCPLSGEQPTLRATSSHWGGPCTMEAR